MKPKQSLSALCLMLVCGFGISGSPVFGATVKDRTEGYILLQVEAHGEAWYVEPLSNFRYYMKDGATAYEMMRTFGLGISEVDYARLQAGDEELSERLRGRIILRVEMHGEAYYIHPGGQIYYLENGEAAYAVMRLHSLGITDADLATITVGDLAYTPTVLGVRDETISPSQYQDGELPSSFDPIQLNADWLALLNAERASRGLNLLTSDQVLLDTSANWSAYMGERDVFTHTRPYGESLLAWVQGFQYPANDFGENLALVYVQDGEQGMEQILTQAMTMFMAEESYNGMHFQNVVDADWNRAGAGFYFERTDASTYRVYATFHFASTPEGL
ncbi:MAG TPA: CAP domain-containing protein [bacterium]|nr:CAP domain-containing protein [bacterium]